jgi:hypothetical protein
MGRFFRPEILEWRWFRPLIARLLMIYMDVIVTAMDLMVEV